jgi:hypothetical protein
MPANKPDFNIADGNVGVISKEGSPLAFVKGIQPNTWFYAPRAARIAKSDVTQKPLFIVARNRVHEAGGQGLKTLGGIFAAQLDITVPAPNLDEIGQWTEYLQRTTGMAPEGSSRGFRTQPLRLRSGTMTITGVESYVEDPKELINIPVGSSPSIPITLKLNALGADTFVSALKENNSVVLPMVASLTFKYDMVLPDCHYKITADTKRVFDYFSVNVKARASYFGLVGAKADISHTRQELEQTGAIKIEQISRPNSLNEERIKQLENSIVDAWTRKTLQQITNPPTMDPAVAADPKGFFGGVSVSMKSYKEVDSLVLSAEFNSQTVQEVDFSVSYVLGQEFMVLDVSSYLLDVLDDNKLPIVINLTECPEVNVYSGQYGYHKQDGSAVSAVITAVKGGEGAVLTGQVQYSTTEPRPDSVDIKLSVDWLNPNWADRVDQIQEEVSDSGVSYTFSPSNFMAKIDIITDLETLPQGSISVLSWRSQLENYKGRPVKVYSGAMYLLGKGEMGSPQTSEIKFPIRDTDQATGKLIWDIVITQPNATPIKKKNNEQSITEATLLALMPLIEDM